MVNPIGQCNEPSLEDDIITFNNTNIFIIQNIIPNTSQGLVLIGFMIYANNSGNITFKVTEIIKLILLNYKLIISLDYIEKSFNIICPTFLFREMT